MTENNSPYEYEKPLKPRQSKRLGFIASLSLLGVGSTFVGSAIASTAISTNSADSFAPDSINANIEDTNAAVDPNFSNGDVTASDQLAATSPQSITEPAPSNNVAVPPVKAAPSKSSTQLTLPVPAPRDFGNVSSATPSAGAGNGAAAGGYAGSNTGFGGREHGDHEAREQHGDRNDDFNEIEND